MKERSAFELIVIIAAGIVVGCVVVALIGFACSWVMNSRSAPLNTFIGLAAAAAVITILIWAGRSIDSNREM